MNHHGQEQFIRGKNRNPFKLAGVLHDDGRKGEARMTLDGSHTPADAPLPDGTKSSPRVCPPRLDFTIREEANAITCYALRNGHIENVHASDRSRLLGHNKRERIPEADMQKILSDAEQSIATLLTMKAEEPDRYRELVAWYNSVYVRNWVKDEPEVKRRRPVRYQVAAPTTVAEEARGIVSYTFRDGFILDIRDGVCPELQGSPEHLNISDKEMAVLMIVTSARMAELLSLKAHDPDRYHYMLHTAGQTIARPRKG